jgi:hypothetical protein
LMLAPHAPGSSIGKAWPLRPVTPAALHLSGTCQEDEVRHVSSGPGGPLKSKHGAGVVNLEPSRARSGVGPSQRCATVHRVGDLAPAACLSSEGHRARLEVARHGGWDECDEGGSEKRAAGSTDAEGQSQRVQYP